MISHTHIDVATCWHLCTLRSVTCITPNMNKTSVCRFGTGCDWGMMHQVLISLPVWLALLCKCATLGPPTWKPWMVFKEGNLPWLRGALQQLASVLQCIVTVFHLGKASMRYVCRLMQVQVVTVWCSVQTCSRSATGGGKVGGPSLGYFLCWWACSCTVTTVLCTNMSHQGVEMHI